jgi:nitrate/nitrite transport system substrate-binding protein
MGGIEKTKLTVGYIPIIDCAPVILANELGAFERQGLEVEIRREVSWSNVRDRLALGVLDAAHILAPLPLAITLGIDSVTVPLVNVMTLEVNGNALTLSNALWQEIEEAAPDLAFARPLEARALAAVVARRAAAGRPPLVLASVFPFSVQNYMLRLWLSSGGLDPDRDLRLVTVPPPHTVAHLSGGVIDGYCVGEPWNQQAQAQAQGIGRIALTGLDIWKGMPEKVFGTTEAFAAKNPGTVKALIKALLEACQWLDEPGNRAEAARVLSIPRYLNTPADVLARTLERPDFHVFHRGHANFPWRSHADWFLNQMVRWGQAAPDIDVTATADRVYRTDLYRAAASEMGVACPAADRLPPGGHGEPVTAPTDLPSPAMSSRLRTGESS